AGFERVHRRLVHPDLLRVWLADDDRAHQAGMVVPIGPREFERELVLRFEVPPAAEVAAEQRVLARAYDELVGRIVAAVAEDRTMHGGENLAFVSAGSGQTLGFIEGEVGQLRRL